MFLRNQPVWPKALFSRRAGIAQGKRSAALGRRSIASCLAEGHIHLFDNAIEMMFDLRPNIF